MYLVYRLTSRFQLQVEGCVCKSKKAFGKSSILRFNRSDEKDLVFAINKYRIEA